MTGERYDVLDDNGDVLVSSDSRALAFTHLRNWQEHPGQGCVRDNEDDEACPKCGGSGIVETRPRLYGTLACADPFDEIPCPRCGGGDHVH